MSIVIAILCYWLLLSAVTTACFCWLLHTKRIQFHEIDPIERREFIRMVKGARP